MLLEFLLLPIPTCFHTWGNPAAPQESPQLPLVSLRLALVPVCSLDTPGHTWTPPLRAQTPLLHHKFPGNLRYLQLKLHSPIFLASCSHRGLFRLQGHGSASPGSAKLKSASHSRLWGRHWVYLYMDIFAGRQEESAVKHCFNSVAGFGFAKYIWNQSGRIAFIMCYEPKLFIIPKKGAIKNNNLGARNKFREREKSKVPKTPLFEGKSANYPAFCSTELSDCLPRVYFHWLSFSEVFLTYRHIHTHTILSNIPLQIQLNHCQDAFVSIFAHLLSV